MAWQDHMDSEPLFKHIWQGNRKWRLPMVFFLGVLLFLVGARHRTYAPDVISPPPAAEQNASDKIAIELPPPKPTPPPWPLFTHPTHQRNWAETENPKVYMPTGSGRVASAGYGSVRTNSSGRAVFHEGVDIAPVSWDSRRRAADKIFAVADGVVGYINKYGGNSSYGVYIVLNHQDDVGEVFTLYAHLASVSEDLKVGQRVERGQEIGQMGHSSTLGIPVRRSHLHFEMGMMLNPSFEKWYRKKKMTPNHGRYHGFNFAGFDPRLMLIPLSGREDVRFSYLFTLKNKSPAWQLLVRSKKRPRYFDQYPLLWEDAPYKNQVMLLKVSESGIPLAGRNATAAETELLGNAKTRVNVVDEDVLGRNGLRHVTKSRGTWTLGSNGTRWLEILMHDAR